MAKDLNSWTDGPLEERKISTELAGWGLPSYDNYMLGCHIGFGDNGQKP